MMSDNRETTGWCIVEETMKMADNYGYWYKAIGKFWVMLVDDNQWYPHGWFPDYHKALKRMTAIENGEIQAW